MKPLLSLLQRSGLSELVSHASSPNVRDNMLLLSDRTRELRCPNLTNFLSKWVTRRCHGRCRPVRISNDDFVQLFEHICHFRGIRSTADLPLIRTMSGLMAASAGRFGMFRSRMYHSIYVQELIVISGDEVHDLLGATRVVLCLSEPEGKLGIDRL